MSLLYSNACKSSSNTSNLSFSKMRLDELFDSSIYLPQQLINRCFSSSTRYWCLINNNPTDDEIIIYVIDSASASALNLRTEENPYYVMRVNLLQEQFRYNPSSLSNTWLMYKSNSKTYVNFDPNYYSCVNTASMYYKKKHT